MKTVLVVDDSATVRQQVGSTLRQAGFVVKEAVDGQDGAEQLAAAPEISVIVSDINMPRMSGIEMLKKVRATGSKVPVIMLTTESQPALIREAKEHGASGWVVKPFKAALLVAAVTKLAA